MTENQRIPLRLWRGLDPNIRAPRKTPGCGSKHVLVIGGGGTALVVVWILFDHDYQVTLTAMSLVNTSGRLTSPIAGALGNLRLLCLESVSGHHREYLFYLC